jgi:1-acyl-sn-glycerol-3-phosphate acyltransferase
MSRDAEHQLLWEMGRLACRILTSVLFDFKVYGAENIPKHGGVLLISNHQSFLDPILLGVKARRPISFIAKSELFEHPFFNWLIRKLNSFPIRRGQTDVAAIKEAMRRLKEGRVVAIFPEGTRSRDGEIQPIHQGIAMLVRRGGVPVVPAVIDGAYRAWPRGEKVFQRYPIRAAFGPPLDTANLKSEEIIELLEASMKKMLVELRQRETPSCQNDGPTP